MQVTRDFEVVDLPHETVSLEDRRAVLSGRGRAWLKRGTSDAGSWRPRKKRRINSFQWLCCLNDALASASHDRINLGKLVVDADPAKRPRALEWMSASCCADRGADGVSASFWCRVPARMNLDFVWDMSHIITNAVDEATRCAGLRALASLMDLASNARHGPWSEGSRWQQVVNVLEYYFDVMTLDTCSHAQTLLPKIMRDHNILGGSMDFSKEGCFAEVWETMRSGLPWKSRGTPIAGSRFLGSVKKAKEDDPHFHSLGFGYLLACIELDYLHGARFEEAFINKLAEKTGGAPHKSPFFKLGECAETKAAEAGLSMAAQKAAGEASLRSCFQNYLAFGCMLYAEDSHQNYQRIRFLICGPVIDFHRRSNVTLRSLDATLPWYIELLKGDIVQLYSDTLATLEDVDILAKIGFTVLGTVTAGAAWRDQRSADQRNLTIQAEDEMAGVAVSYALNLVSALAKRLLWLHRGWPTAAAGLVDDDLRDSTLARFKKDLSLYEELKSSPSEADQAISKRSVFRQIPVVQLTQAIDECGGATEEVQTFLRDKYRRLQATQVLVLSTSTFCLWVRLPSARTLNSYSLLAL